VALIDHDALAEPDGAERAAARVPDGGGAAVYRGWMLASDQYAALASALAARGVTLRTSAEQYRRAHELPGWYPALAPVTPAAVWTAGDAEQEFYAACAHLGPGPAVLRDYVKSIKHYWHEAAYIPDVADHTAAWKVAARFREMREDEFTGGGNSPLEHLRGLLRLEGGNRREQFGQRGRLPCRDWPGRLSGRFTLRALARSVVLDRGAAAWARTAAAQTLGCPPRGPVGMLPAMLRTVPRSYPWRQEDLAAQRMSTHAAKDHWPTPYYRSVLSRTLIPADMKVAHLVSIAGPSKPAALHDTMAS
jgi:hypothetical protein